MEITKIKLGNPQEEAPPRRVKKISLRKKIILFSAAAVTIVILLLALLPGSTAFDGLHRFFAYMRVDKDEFGCAELYQYTGEKNCCFASVEDSTELTGETAEPPEMEILREERNRQLYQALSGLNAEYRQVLILLYFEEMSIEDAERVIGKNRKQIYNLAERGRKALRQELERMGFDYAQYG